MSQFKSKEFKDLQAHWYKRLKASGFDDIEQDDEHLVSWHSLLFKTNQKLRGALWEESKAEYYRLAGQFLWDYDFQSHLDKMIWTWHSEGISCREMVKLLKKKGIFSNKDAINNITRRLSQEMLNRWLKNQR